jgi:hypothetical protein
LSPELRHGPRGSWSCGCTTGTSQLLSPAIDRGHRLEFGHDLGQPLHVVADGDVAGSSFCSRSFSPTRPTCAPRSCPRPVSGSFASGTPLVCHRSRRSCHDAYRAGRLINPRVKPVPTRIPKPLASVKRAALARDRAEAAFARSILDASTAGFSYREIARHAGVSKERVGQIILAARRERGARASTGR